MAPKSKNEKRESENGILKYQGQNIVVDTSSHFIFIGKLLDVEEYFLSLADADVHDSRESPSTKEKYILDSKKMGVRVNRKKVYVRRGEIISISLLEDVIEY